MDKGIVTGLYAGKSLTSDIQRELLHRRYLLKDEHGHVMETSDQMWHRVADTVASVEVLYGLTETEIKAQAEVFYHLMAGSYFLPNSPTIMNAGRNNGMLSACFVLPIPDSIEGIFDAVKYTALIQRAGGGTGFAFDLLRPTGDIVTSSGGRTSGPISFWRVLAETTHAIQQGAHRRGANMGMMSLEHPDILKFINAKNSLSAFANFNISVKVSDHFMETLLTSPDDPHIVSNRRTGWQYRIPKKIDISTYAIQDLLPSGEVDVPCYSKKDVWDLIITNAHTTGEPGACFIDRVNRANPTPHIGSINATNPCGEMPLMDFEACNLGSVNVARFVLSNGNGVDWESLDATINMAVRFLDNVIDINHYPIAQIREITLSNRKIGLGIMGFADALILMGIRYDSQEAVEFATRLGQFIQDCAHQASFSLAKVRGNFPNWPGSTWDTIENHPMRNATCTTIAPTGSLSIIAGCSGGIEPVFSLAYKRRALDGQEFIQIHPLLEQLGQRDGWMNEPVRESLLEGVPAEEILSIPDEIAHALVTAHEVSPEWHVRIQAAFQEYTDNAVSKTVNLPASATVEDVDGIFRLAYKLGCKGTTVYRDGSRQGQALSSTNHTHQQMALVSSEPRPRSRITHGQTTKFRMGCGSLFVSVNRDETGLCEVFANLGKAGGCPAQSEATCRIVSAALRCGVEPKVLIEQLKSIRCLSTIAGRKTNKDIDVLSCPDAIARAIEEAIGKPQFIYDLPAGKKCPDCSHPLHHEAGCEVCSNCGYSKCG